MTTQKRIKSKLPSPGPYLAEITNHLDPTYTGGLEVVLIKGVPNYHDQEPDTYHVRYCSPFSGNTSIRFEGPNINDFNDVQKSYGFWMVPPDIGATVMVLFIDGDPNQGYWFGCVQDVFQNHMTPGIAASKNSAVTAEQLRKYGTSLLPVAEFHKSSFKKMEKPDPNSFSKPVHPFADRLVEQGLLLDQIRGVTSSGARREVPSAVFGISTPGPRDEKGRKGPLGYISKKEHPISRLGGTTFVMDDGDVDGQNELVRLRTRTGHQILLHNSSDLIYIANSKGTAWIELTSNGKIDIFAEDSVSIHTKNDFNFRADRDINIEALRNINIKAWQNMETNVGGYQFLTVDQDQKISVSGNYDLNVSGHLYETSGGSNETLSGTSIIETAPVIHMNGPQAASAEIPPDLPLFSLPDINPSVGWSDSKFYRQGVPPLKSIMQRVPTHEPWPQHENIDEKKFSKEATDVSLADRSKNGIPPNPAATTTATTTTSPSGEVVQQPQQQKQEPANQPAIPPGTCDPSYSKTINNPSAQAGQKALKDAATRLGLTNPNAQAALLGIAGGECNWQVQNEKFGYSADRLLQVFPSVFKGDRALAEKYANNPKELPEFLYGAGTPKGNDLGNKLPGDGAKFIGRGYIQLTGRANYTRYSQLLYNKGLVSSPTALVDNPDLVNDPKVAAEVAVLYFQDRVKTSQDDPGYFEKACKAVGYNTPDIKAKKQGYYECFAKQNSGDVVKSGSGGIVTDSNGNPIRSGGGG